MDTDHFCVRCITAIIMYKYNQYEVNDANKWFANDLDNMQHGYRRICLKMSRMRTAALIQLVYRAYAGNKV